MVQNEYSLDPLSKYLKKHPNAKNSELYNICNAETKSQKSTVRTKKGRLLKRKSGAKSDTDLPGPMEKLSSEDLEKRIVNALNRHPDNAQILGKAIEFFIKVKAKTDTMEGEVDMELLKEIGLKITDSS